MALLPARISRVLHQLWHPCLNFSSLYSGVPQKSLNESLKAAVANKRYEQIPELLNSSDESCNKHNPFSFLSSFTPNRRTLVVDEMLQSFIPFKPHSLLKSTYHYLLTYTLQCSAPFPIALATLQCTLRSGCTPAPQTYLSLASAWIDYQHKYESVPSILLSMKSIGYRPDCGTCNFIIKSLCAVDQLEEAVEVLRGMVEVACVPDVESYCTIIAAFCQLRKTDKAVEMMQEMARKMSLSPRQGTLVGLMAALRANKEIWRAVEMIEFLEKKDLMLGLRATSS